MQVHVLSVNGGEVESFLGVFTSLKGAVAAALKEAIGGDFTEDNGYKFGDVIDAFDENGVDPIKCIHVHESDSHFSMWSLLFTIRSTVVQGLTS